MTKTDIISGFLGAGKTTLIKKLIEETYKGEKIVLIENEFGEIGIDGGFLKDAGIEINEMSQGCICCSLVGDFGAALKEVVTKFTPDRILIEPSGVGKLSDVIQAVQGIAEEAGLELNSFVAVVDAIKCKMYMKNFGEFFNNQIEAANTIILSRTQNTRQERLEEAVALIREHNPKAAIITTPWNELTGEQIRSAMIHAQDLAAEMLAEMVFEDECDDPDCECHHHHHHHDDEECECGHEHHHHHHHHDEDECDDPECECHHHHDDDDDEDEHDHHHEHEHHHHDHEHHHHDHDDHHHHHHHGHHHADEVFTSWGVETPHKYAKEDLENILKVLSESNEYGVILRAKGMVPTPEGEWMFFDLTPGEYEIRQGSAEYTGKLCVIGSELKEHELEHLFQLA